MFNNIVNMSVESLKVDNGHFANFKNLTVLYFQQIQCRNFGRVKDLVLLFPKSLVKVTVPDDDTKELFKLVSRVTKKTFSVYVIREQAFILCLC